MSDRKVVEEARANWKLTSGVYGQQKQDEIEDLKFLLPENQWEQWALDERKALPQHDLAARPHPSIDKLSQPINIQVNKIRNAHLGITVNPESEDADKETADIIQGVYRKWEQTSNADLARYWAVDRAIKCGTGVYYVGYDYDRTTGHPFDQSVVWKRILNQADVYFDPTATEMDWSDGEFVFWVKWLSRDQFTQKYGDRSELAKRLASSGSDGWAESVQAAPEWANSKEADDSKPAIMVSEYWKKVYKDRLALLLDDWSFVYDGEQPIPKGRRPMLDDAKKAITRVVKDQSLMYYVLTGLEDKPLKSEKWNGRYFPFVPTIGYEIQTFDDRRRWRGMVRNAKDPQRIFNYSFANTVEIVSMETKATHLLDPRQISKYRAWWNVKNIRPLPFLPYDAQVDGGQALPPPTVTQVDSGKLNQSIALLKESGQAIDDVTATYAPSRGEVDSHRSGKAVLALQSQSDESSGGFELNFVDISLPCEARIVLDYMPTLLERPGRMLDIIDANEQTQRVMLNQPHVTRGGKPQAVPQGTAGAKFFDLRKGIYSVETEAGKSYASRLKQGQEQYPLLMQALPPEAALILAPDVIRFSPAPGASATADKIQKFVDHQFPFLAESPDGAEKTPEQMKAELAKLGQTAQQMDAALKQAATEVKTDQAKQQATIQKAQLDAQVEIQKMQVEAATTAAKTQTDNATKIEVAKINAETQLSIAELKVGQEAMADKLGVLLGLLQEQTRQQQEKRLDDEQGAHEVGLEAMKHANAKELAQQQHEHAGEMMAAETESAAEEAAAGEEPE